MVDTALDPTSHNLWPFGIGMFAFAALATGGGFVLMRRLMGADRG